MLLIQNCTTTLAVQMKINKNLSSVIRYLYERKLLAGQLSHTDLYFYISLTNFMKLFFSLLLLVSNIMKFRFIYLKKKIHIDIVASYENFLLITRYA